MIAIGNISSGSKNGGNNLVISHTIAAGSDRLLVVHVTLNNPNLEVVDEITYDGVNLLLLAAVSQNNDTRTEMWYMIAPPVGTADIAIQVDVNLEAASGFNGAGVDWTGVDQATPIGNSATAGGISITPSVVVSSAVDEMVIDTMGAEDMGGETATAGSGQTDRVNIQSGTGSRTEQLGVSDEAGAASVTMDWTLSVSTDWAIAGGALLPAASVVPPTVDAGGPYNGDVDVATALNGTVTPGSDPTPVLTWTIDSGPGSGVFLPSASVEDPTFTPDTVGSYVLRLEANPSDGPPVFDTATFESDPVEPIVDAGGPYSGTVDTPIALNATVTPGSDPAPTLLWTIDSGPGTGVFLPSATVEDPTFTPDLTGTYTLRLTATPSDTAPVFDTASLDSQGFVPVSAQSVVGIKTDNLGRPVCAFLGIADPLPVGAVILAGDALAFDGTLLVAIDDGLAPRTVVNGLPHTHNGIRIVIEAPGDVNLNGWRLKSEPVAQCINDGPPPPTPFYNKGFAIDGTGLLFVVDGGPAPTPPALAPPSLPNLQHWFDMTDGTTQWQNSAGTIPAVNGQDIDRIDNKGTDGQPLIDTLGGRPFYTLGLINGLSGWDDGGGSGQLTTIMTNGGSVNGISWAGVVRRDSSLAQGMFSWNGPTRVLRAVTLGNWEAFVSPPPTVQDSNKLVVINEWVWAYFSQDSLGNWKFRVSGAAEVTGTNAPFAPNTPGNSLTLSAGPTGKMAEWLIWDKGLSSIELTALVDYFNTKFGVMPF